MSWRALFSLLLIGGLAGPLAAEEKPRATKPTKATEATTEAEPTTENRTESTAKPNSTSKSKSKSKPPRSFPGNQTQAKPPGQRIWTPLQLSLYFPNQIFDATRDVYGLRLNLIHGRNRRVYGFDLGLFNEAEALRGFQFGLVNWIHPAARDVAAVTATIDLENESSEGNRIESSGNEGDSSAESSSAPQEQTIPAGPDGNATGLQVGLVNLVPGRMTGLQLGLFVNVANSCGACFQLGGMNFTDGDVDGMQLGIFGNVADGRVLAPQISLGWNYAEKVYGGQISLGGNITGYAPYQIAGFWNASEKSWFQLAGGLNIGDDIPIQIAGIGNGADNPFLQIALGGNFADDLTGIQLAGLGNAASGYGLQLAGLGNFSDDFIGAQIALGANISEKMSGVQIAILGNHAETGRVAQIALFNNGVDIKGFQFGPANFANHMDGVQIGAVNRTRHMRGMMFGLINDTDTLDGSQFGLLNIIRTGPLPFMVFYNAASMDPECKNLRSCKGDDIDPKIRKPVAPDASGDSSSDVNGDPGDDPNTVASPTQPDPTTRHGWTPLQLSLYHPAQVFSENTDVYGLRLNLLHGRNRRVYGVDLGLYNEAESIRGFQAGLLNWIHDPYKDDPSNRPPAAPGGQMKGVQIGFVNVVPREVAGIQIGLFLNTAKECSYCFQLGAFNFSDGDVRGMQLGLLGNFADGDVWAPQIALGYNVAENAYLGQVTAGVNVASEGSPFQLGGIGNLALNIKDQSKAPYFQIAGMFNGGADVPIQFAGIVNVAKSPYLQIALGGNVAAGEMYGLQLAGGFNWSADERARGLQLAGLFNNAEDLGGAQIALGGNFAEKINGIQLAFIGNHAEAGTLGQIALFNNVYDTRGFQVGAVNFAGRIKGAQVGLVNRSEHVDGIMFGLINDANTLDGLQLGVINIVREAAWPVTILFNAASMDADCRARRSCQE